MKNKIILIYSLHKQNHKKEKRQKLSTQVQKKEYLFNNKNNYKNNINKKNINYNNNFMKWIY